MRQAVIEIVQAGIGARDQTFSDSNTRSGKRLYLLLDDLRQPTFSVPDVYDRVSAVINHGVLRNPHALRAVHQTRASLRGKQLDGAQATLCAEGIAARNAAPRHDVHTGENLPGQLRRLWRLDRKTGDVIEKKSSDYCAAFAATHI